MALKLLFQPWRWREGHASLSLREAIATKQSAARLPRPRQARPRNDIISRNDDLRNDYALKVQLFVKGRQAIEAALRRIGVKSGDEVILQAFTCVAVVEPILNLGAVPVYADVTSKSLNPSLENIKKVVSEKTKAVILQHTLGYVNVENEEIVGWCEKNNIIVIQDLAHVAIQPHKDSPSHGRRILSILSFSQDKMFDGVSGGVLISNQGADKKFDDSNHQSGNEIAKLLIYPLVAHIIRSTYNLRLGKVIHFMAKKMSLMNSPIYTPKKTTLPNAFAALALQQFNRLDEIIEHRRKIALQYNELINKNFRIVGKSDIENGSNLRYPLWVNNRDKLENELQKHNYYLYDHWYDAPVSPKWIRPDEVKYKRGSCPNTESLSKHIFNLPTHANISVKKAKELAKLINKYAV